MGQGYEKSVYGVSKRAGETRRAARERVGNRAKMSDRPRGRAGGESGDTSLPPFRARMMAITRRQVLAAAGTIIAAVLTVGSARVAWAIPKRSSGRRRIYRLSSRGRRASRGTRAYHANMRFRTRRAADQNRAHPGDHARIVPLTVSIEEFHRLFHRGYQLVDLRTL